MRNVKHTPGPWEVAGFGSVVAPVDRNGSIICSMHGKESVYQGDKCGANARLIAAAPDLLEAARKVIRARHDDTYFLDFAGAIRDLERAVLKVEDLPR